MKNLEAQDGAILHNEPERRQFNEALEAAESRLLSVAMFVEVSIVIESRYGTEGHTRRAWREQEPARSLVVARVYTEIGRQP